MWLSSLSLQNHSLYSSLFLPSKVESACRGGRAFSPPFWPYLRSSLPPSTQIALWLLRVWNRRQPPIPASRALEFFPVFLRRTPLRSHISFPTSFSARPFSLSRIPRNAVFSSFCEALLRRSACLKPTLFSSFLFLQKCPQRPDYYHIGSP